MQLRQWGHYWQSGHLTSLPQDFIENYEDEIKLFWVERLHRLVNDARILDVCTGNGAIAVLMQDYCLKNNHHFKITATDGALIDTKPLAQRYPKYSSHYKAVEFITGEVFENIDLGELKFDLITSQYGIEYTNWELSAKKIYNLLATDGEFSFISHSPESDITTYMKQERTEYQYLEAIGFFKIISNYLNSTIGFSEVYKQIKKINKQIRAKFKFSKSPLIKGIINFCTHVSNIEAVQFEREKLHLQKFYQDHLSAFERLKDILNVSERISSNPEWYNAFTDAGLELVNNSQVYQNKKHLAGHSYIFKKK